MSTKNTPDKFDLYILNVDDFKSMNKEKNELKEKIEAMRLEFEEKVRPYEQELNGIIRKLELSFSRFEGSPAPKPGVAKFGRGILGASIKGLLQGNPDKEFKPKDIAAALQTKGTAVSLWFNKYGNNDPEIERIPVGAGGKRFVYKIKR
jgi:hypothetical protein